MERETKATVVVVAFTLFCIISGALLHCAISKERYVVQSKCENGSVNVKIEIGEEEGVWYETGALCSN